MIINRPTGHKIEKMEKCCYCEAKLTPLTRTKEHLIPKSRGGNNSQLNLKPCCKSCNEDRGHKSLTEWMATMDQEKDRLRIKNIKIWLVYIENWKYNLRTSGSGSIVKLKIINKY